ncbi:uncharacterized protein TNCV_655921 [Trichonephila clavipes]|nr:uncharacterized protein TNCV_655921 [Trichonephila clavipes]
MHDRTCHAMLKSSLPLRLNCFLGLLCSDLSPVKRVLHACTTTGRDTPSAATPDQLWQYLEAAWTDVSQGYIQSLFNCMPRLVVAVIVTNGGYTNY